METAGQALARHGPENGDQKDVMHHRPRLKRRPESWISATTEILTIWKIPMTILNIPKDNQIRSQTENRKSESFKHAAIHSISLLIMIILSSTLTQDLRYHPP
jgi:hypothetical protein